MTEKEPRAPRVRLKVGINEEDIAKLRSLATPDRSLSGALRKAIQQAKSPREKNN